MLKDEFISDDHRQYRWKIGQTVASGLTGFIVGFLITFILLGLWIYIESGR